MLPWVYGFSWQAGNLIFLTIFYSVVAVIFTALAVAAMRAFRDVRSGRMDEIRWHVDFNDLPDFARLCRETLTSGVDTHICRNHFDCTSCERYRASSLAGRMEAGSVEDMQDNAGTFGLDMPSDRLYHRGHTWVRKENDGTLTVGLDDLGKRIAGRSCITESPQPGTRLTMNGTGWYLRKGRNRTRVLSPVNGTVIAVGNENDDFVLKVDPGVDCDLRHLLKRNEVHPWMMREVERLQASLATERLGMSLADGGELVADLRSYCPDADWDRVESEIFLES